MNQLLEINSNRQFQPVTPEEWAGVLKKLRGRKRAQLFQAIRYLDTQKPGTVVKVQFPEGTERSARRRTMDSVRGYADRRGFQVKNVFKDGWLYIERAL